MCKTTWRLLKNTNGVVGKIFDVECIYRAPKKEQQHVNTFLDKLDEFLTDLGNDSVLVVDFNFNLNNINATSMYLNLIGSHVFFIYVYTQKKIM
jgi:hypothetical protein